MILMINHAYPQVIIVSQDGTGDFTMIQDAVDAADNGDTVIVYPGIYFENVDLTEKGIVLASTWLLFQHDSLISQTIIDENQSGSCIKSESGSEWKEVTGFTLQHGNGINYLEEMYPYFYGRGGGVYIWFSKMKVTFCRILDNFGWHGAGIYSSHSSVEFDGGISTGFSGKLTLDSIALINTTGDLDVGIYSDSGDSIIISNSVFENCSGNNCVLIFNLHYSFMVPIPFPGKLWPKL
jgi:hypothetical protein